MRKLVLSICVSLLGVIFISSAAHADPLYVSGSKGLDVSWPNCSSKITKADFGIVGVNDGQGYSENPCLLSEASHFTALSLYANTGWDAKSSHINSTSPEQCAATDENCLAYNYGYNAGLYAYNYAASLGLSANSWWLDVETANTWSNNATQNQNSLQGEYNALSVEGVQQIGVYSTTAQWNVLTNSWQNNWPSWGATTWKTAKQAATYCSGHQFTGGSSILMQFLPKTDGLDHDVAC